MVNGYELKSKGELAEEYRELWDRKEELTKAAKEIGQLMDRIQGTILSKMDEEEIESFKTDTITIGVKETIKPKVADWPSVFDWIYEGGRFQLLMKSMNSRAFREIVENGDPLPDCIEIESFKKMTRRRK